jgi:hypothetical protein
VSDINKWRKTFWQVSDFYLDARNTPSLCAINYDETVPNRRMGANLIHFIVDCENATKKALDNDPELLERWQTIIEKEKDVPGSASIISKCGRLYSIRKLIPSDYFRVIRKGRPGRGSALLATGAA